VNVVSVAVAALGALLPITNPLGALAAYAGLTGGFTPDQVRAQAVRTAAYVFAILAVFTLLGSLVLEAFGISLPALQIAGGIVVAHSGFTMISPREQFSDAEKAHAQTKQDVSFSPMALPLVAGPGAIGVVIALSARYPGIGDRLGVVAGVAVVAAAIGVLLRYGTPLVARLGPTGIGALTRIMGFLILAIGVELVTHGVLAVAR
jgi:multiple antibiotic resistance protein